MKASTCQSNSNTKAFTPNSLPQPMAGQFRPLSEETREVIPTEVAAFYINRKPQTLRSWSCCGGGLLQPVRIGTRLGWRVSDIRRLLGVQS